MTWLDSTKALKRVLTKGLKLIFQKSLMTKKNLQDKFFMTISKDTRNIKNLTKFSHLHEQLIQLAIVFASIHGAVGSTTSQVGISIGQYTKLLESIQV